MAIESFVPSATQYVPFEKRYDANGKVYLQVQAHGLITKLTPYAIVANEFGLIAGALPGSGKYIYVGVPDRFTITAAAVTAAAAAGSYIACWLQIGGYIANMITASIAVTVGHGLTINTNAVADIGFDFSGAAGEFCACAVTTSSSQATQTVMLVPERIITI